MTTPQHEQAPAQQSQNRAENQYARHEALRIRIQERLQAALRGHLPVMLRGDIHHCLRPDMIDLFIQDRQHVHIAVLRYGYTYRVVKGNTAILHELRVVTAQQSILDDVLRQIGDIGPAIADRLQAVLR